MWVQSMVPITFGKWKFCTNDFQKCRFIFKLHVPPGFLCFSFLCYCYILHIFVKHLVTEGWFSEVWISSPTVIWYPPSAKKNKACENLKKNIVAAPPFNQHKDHTCKCNGTACILVRSLQTLEFLQIVSSLFIKSEYLNKFCNR